MEAMVQGDARLAPLVELRARLRAEVDKLQGRDDEMTRVRRWRGEDLETKERRLRLLETTMELLQWLLEKQPAVGERVPQTARATGGSGKLLVGRGAEERLKD
jgi:hypothetical protein